MRTPISIMARPAPPQGIGGSLPGPGAVRAATVGERAPPAGLVRFRRRRQRGIALLMVLGALTILAVMLTEFQDDTSAEFGSALSARDALKAEYAAMSAVNLSRLFIASEPTIRRSLAPLFMMMRRPPPQIPVWEFADQVLGAFNDASGNESFQALASVKLAEGKNLGLPEAGFDVVVIDEDSKINLNAAWRDPMTQMRLSAELLGLMNGEQFSPLFESRDAEGHYSDRQTICGAIIDWVDPNQDLFACDMQPTGAQSAAPEDAFYERLNPSYRRKNAPFDSLEELRLVRGVGDDFWSTFVETDHNDPSKRNVTVWGQGKINVNTANAMTILAIICGGTRPPATVCTNPAEALNFMSLVTLIRNMTRGVPLFSSPKGFIDTLAQQSDVGQMLRALGLQPIQFFSPAETMKSIATESKVFSIIATGRVKAGKRETRVRIHTVVDFRGAPAPPQIDPLMLEQLGQPGMADVPPGAGAGAAGAGAVNLPDGATEAALLGTLRPDPGGRVIYYRVD
jgi:general secretion pathway protein K